MSAAAVRTKPVVDNLDPLLPMLARGSFVTDPTVLPATWNDWGFVFAGESRQQELADKSVYTLTLDGHGGSLVIVDGHSMCQLAAPSACGARLQTAIVLSPIV